MATFFTNSRRQTLSWLAIYWERLWPALWPVVGLLGLFVDRAEMKARNFVVCDTPAGLVIEDKVAEPMAEERWEAKYGLPADR